MLTTDTVDIAADAAAAAAQAEAAAAAAEAEEEGGEQQQWQGGLRKEYQAFALSDLFYQAEEEIE